MRYLIMTDIEGVTGVTTFAQAESGVLGREMLMHDLLAVIEGIRFAGEHEIVLYDMHTDGRNIDLSRLPARIPAVMGKPIDLTVYRGVGGDFDGLFMVGLHAMRHAGRALLEHTYLRDYAAIRINDVLVGEIGMEAALAGEQGIPLLFVSGDDRGCNEAEALVPGVQTAAVKRSIDLEQALCHPPSYTAELLRETAARAVAMTKTVKPLAMVRPYSVTIDIMEGECLSTLRTLHPEIFIDEKRIRVHGDTLLGCWSDYLLIEREMILACAEHKA